MATHQARLEALAVALGTDVKSVKAMIGTLASLNTSNKTNLVLAINEVLAGAGMPAASNAETLAFALTTKAVTPGSLGSVRNVANGLAGLDGTGKVAAAQLPAYVDDVQEAANFAALPGTGATGIIYTTLNDNKVFRWSGSAYVEISASPGSTDAVPEGATNLYYTQARADARVNAIITTLFGDPDANLVTTYTTARDS